MERLDLVERIVICRACELCNVGTGPIPFSGPTPADFAILGEAPGREEDIKGQPFLGPSGRLLRSCLEAAGLDVARAFIFNTASCFPNDTPTQAQVDACDPHYRDQLAISGTGPVLVLGSTALGKFRGDLHTVKARGHVFKHQGRVLLTTFHPAYVLRSAKARTPIFQGDIDRFADVVAAGEYWPGLILNQCVYCQKPEEEMLAQHVDDDGLLFCEQCWPRSPGGGKGRPTRHVPSRPDENVVGVMPSQPMDTSEAAAWAVLPRTGTQRMTILEWLVARGDQGGTDEETRLALGMRYSSVTTRRDELRKGGWVKDSGARRATTSGESAAVWVVTEKAGAEFPEPVKTVSSGYLKQCVGLVQRTFPGTEVVEKGTLV